MIKKIDYKIFIYIVIAFVFSVGLRYIYVNEISNISDFFWQNKLMINTNDGYFFAEGARDIIAGFHQKNDLSPIDYPLSIITAFLAKSLGISFEKLIWAS